MPVVLVPPRTAVALYWDILVAGSDRFLVISELEVDSRAMAVGNDHMLGISEVQVDGRAMAVVRATVGSDHFL